MHCAGVPSCANIQNYVCTLFGSGKYEKLICIVSHVMSVIM